MIASAMLLLRRTGLRCAWWAAVLLAPATLGCTAYAQALVDAPATAPEPAVSKALRAPAAERQRLSIERKLMAARFAAEERDCSTRFAVNACIDDVRARRRSETAPLRERELQLDEAERGDRATARRAAIAARQAQAASRPAALPDPPPRARRPASAAPPAVFTPRPPPDQRARQAEADERARELQQRRQEAEAAQQRIQRRQAERKASGRTTDALPVP